MLLCIFYYKQESWKDCCERYSYAFASKLRECVSSRLQKATAQLVRE